MTGGSRLSALANIARRAGAHEIARETEAVAERAREGRFYVVCVGQFKRGKSALVNALEGQPLLPTGVGAAAVQVRLEALEALRSEAEALVPRQEA